MGDPTYYVLYCSDDDSHVLLEDTALLYDGDHILKEDGCRFFFPGHKKPLEGVVKGISKDYKEMVNLQNELNKASKPKRDPSFDITRPRKAAVKCKEGLKSNPKQSAAPERQPTVKGSSKLKPLATLLSTYTDSDSDSTNAANASAGLDGKKAEVSDHNDSESSGTELTPEELALLSKLSKKKSAKNFDLLRQLSSVESKSNSQPGSSTHSAAENYEVLHQPECTQPTANIQDLQTSKLSKCNSKPTFQPGALDENAISEDKRGDELDKEKSGFSGKRAAEDSSSDEELPASKSKVKRRKGRSTVPCTTIPYEGEHYRWKETDPKVEKLHTAHDVFVRSKDLKRLKAKALTGTALARGALRIVFTDLALEKCSVSGKPAPGKNGVRERRTALHQDGIDAILDFVKHRLSKSKQHCTESALKQAMANLLCEERSKVPITENV